MEHHYFLNLLLVLHHETVHQELSLQKLLLLNRAVEESLELQVPEEVALILFLEKVCVEILSEIFQYDLKGLRLVSVKDFSHRTVEECEVIMVCVNKPMENLRILLSEHGHLELVISNCLCFLFSINLLSI